MGWLWSFWELCWLSIPIAILVVSALPETSPDTILLRRAQRLRKLTGRTNLKSASEIKQEDMKVGEVVFDALIKPWEINVLDPAVLFSTLYMALTYGIYYSFFESFPMVFGDMYSFNLGSLGLSFLSILIGLVAGVILLCVYVHFISPRRLAKLDPIPPEARIWPGLFAAFLIPIGLFTFGKFQNLRAFNCMDLINGSLDYQSFHPLGRMYGRSKHQHVWRLYHHAVHVCISPLYLPPVQRLTIRCQRNGKGSLRWSRNSVLAANV